MNKQIPRPLIALLCASILVGCGDPPPSVRVHAPAQQKNLYGSEAEAYLYSQDFVRERLQSPSTADFPWFDYKARYKGGGRYSVRGYCDAQNKFGGIVRVNYSCEMWYQRPDRWSCSGLVLAEK